MAGLVDRVTATLDRPREVARAAPISKEEFRNRIINGGPDRQLSTSRSGVGVSTNAAMGQTGWKRGVTYLTEQVAGLPWHHYARVAFDERERRGPQPWLERPDVEQTWYGFIEYVMVALLHRGNAFAFKMRNGAGQVVGLREIHPDRVTCGIAPDSTKRFLVDHDPTQYTTREILHIPGMCIDAGRFGYNPIQLLANPLGAVIAGDEYASRFYSGGAHMGGVLSTTEHLTQEQALAQKAVWDQFHQGLLNAHQTGVLSAGYRYDRISLNAEDAQLLESRQFGITEMARMIGLPPHKLYELSRSTNNNIEHQAIEAVTDSIRPWVQRIEHPINADPDLVLPGHYIEGELAGLLRGDSQAITASLQGAVLGGWMTPGTAARLQNQPSPVELDYYLRPLNYAVIVPGVGEIMPAGGEAA